MQRLKQLFQQFREKVSLQVVFFYVFSFLVPILRKLFSLVAKLCKMCLFFAGLAVLLLLSTTFGYLVTDYIFNDQPIIRQRKSGQVVPVISKTPNLPAIFSPNTKWQHMTPCGVYFDEAEELKKTLECANTKVWKKNPVPNIKIPRCFVVTAASPDVTNDRGFNVMVIMNAFMAVGYFDTETDTLFVVENIDAAKIYRHELQHLFLQIQTGNGGGHDQPVWELCEPPYYMPSTKAQLQAELTDLDKLRDKRKK